MEILRGPLNPVIPAQAEIQFCFEAARHALARVLDPPDDWTKFFACGDLLLVNSDKK